MVKKILKYTGSTLLTILLIIAGTVGFLHFTADMLQPDFEVDLADYTVTEYEGYRECDGNYLRYNDKGIWETYLHGEALERGIAFGRLAEELLYYQEKVFVDRIKEIVPSESYLKFLRFLIVVFNRKLGEAVPEEYRREIYGISLSCTDEFDAIGTPYERQLNYHAAHDIGHTMQDYMLVGCSAFAAWGVESGGTGLIVGRNFDFWVGDDFAENKLVSFYAPAEGHRFAGVGWPGMAGILSGMNDKGLTVTINAAKGSLPKAAATPISILAREILQYASDIEEAYRIAQSRRTFVSESLLIGSASDKCAAVIEKTPDVTALFTPSGERLVVTNHYQSTEFEKDKYNIENITGSDSKFRWDRLNELLDTDRPTDERRAAAILRDRLGCGGQDIGLTNEKSINQSIAHHSVIFRPEELLMWVSTGPWQSGEYICYDLAAVFVAPDFTRELHIPDRLVPADSLFITRDHYRIQEHRQTTRMISEAIAAGNTLPEGTIEKYISNNPLFFETHEIAGDYYRQLGEIETALQYYTRALELEIPKLQQRENIGKKVKKLK